MLNFDAILQYLPGIPTAIANTALLALLTTAISFVVGFFGGVARGRGSTPVRVFLKIYVEVMRNVPLLVVLYIIYFALPQIGWRASGFVAASIALTLNSIAYMIEIFRAGLAAVPAGQFIAARSQGMTTMQQYRFVIGPQLLRISYGPLGNQIIGILIGTSLASLVTVEEITAWMDATGAASFRYFEAFLITGGIYLTLCQAVNAIRLIVGRVLFGTQRRDAR